MPTITIYTDGSALGNPGPGGYGAVLLSGQHRKELSQGFRLTTNNRMELMAVCVALEALKFDGSDVTVYSDSKYVVDAVTKGWLFSWVKKRFAGKKNPDLWMRFLRVYRHHNVMDLLWARVLEHLSLNCMKMLWLEARIFMVKLLDLARAVMQVISQRQA